VSLGIAGALPGLSDTAALFDGATGYVDVGSTAFNFSNNFSVEAWVSGADTMFVSGASRFLSTRSASGGWGAGIGVSRRLLFTTYGVQDYLFTTALPNDGNYHHVVFVMDSANAVRLYLDGAFRVRRLRVLHRRAVPGRT
jgi:hypothetical protein